MLDDIPFPFRLLCACLCGIRLQGSTLTSIGLFGTVALIVLWPVFENFRLLEKVSAEFRASGVDITAAAATQSDEYLRIHGELAKRELELKWRK